MKEPSTLARAIGAALLLLATACGGSPFEAVGSSGASAPATSSSGASAPATSSSSSAPTSSSSSSGSGASASATSGSGASAPATSSSSSAPTSASSNVDPPDAGGCPIVAPVAACVYADGGIETAPLPANVASCDGGIAPSCAGILQSLHPSSNEWAPAASAAIDALCSASTPGVCLRTLLCFAAEQTAAQLCPP